MEKKSKESKKQTGIGISKWRAPWAQHATPCTFRLRTLIQMLEGTYDPQIPALNLNPDYQRGSVWTDQQASRFVGSWLQGADIPKIYIQQYHGERTGGKNWLALPEEVLDGQQRLRALWRWFFGEIPAEIRDGRQFLYADTSEIERRGLEIQLCYVDLPRVERLEFYLLLNTGGTVHTDEEINRVRAMVEAERKNKD